MGKKIAQNGPALIIGRFVITKHSYKEKPSLDHQDLFLYFNENSFLITYKLPKNTESSYGIRQKDHRLKYMAYEGTLKENESLEIEKRGYCITHNWVFTNPLNNYAKITYEELNGSLENMWKKTDFKIALDEIVLYEVNDERHIQTDKQISVKVIEKEPEEKPEENPEEPVAAPETDIIEVETPEAIESEVTEPEETIKEQTSEGEQAEIPSPKEPEPEESEPKTEEETREQEITSDEAEIEEVSSAEMTTPSLKKTLQPVEEISYAPIKEMVLNSDGKSEEEYEPSQ